MHKTSLRWGSNNSNNNLRRLRLQRDGRAHAGRQEIQGSSVLTAENHSRSQDGHAHAGRQEIQENSALCAESRSRLQDGHARAELPVIQENSAPSAELQIPHSTQV